MTLPAPGCLAAICHAPPHLHACHAPDGTAAGASASFLPAQSSPALAPLNFSYDLSVWQGNTTAYMQCGLDGRAPGYLGTCQPANVSCAATGNDTTPYNCTIAATGAAVPGNLSSVAYR